MSRRSVLVEALAATPRDLARTLRPVDTTAALLNPTPNDWNISQVVAHLGNYEQHCQTQLRLIIAQDTPNIGDVPSAANLNDCGKSITDLLTTFSARRSETVAWLAELSQQDWARKYVHTTRGPARLRDLVQALVDHDSAHLNQIISLREWIDTQR